MPEETNSGVTESSVNQTSEVVGHDGTTVSTPSTLSSIFDKIQAGQSAADAVKEVGTSKAPDQAATTSSAETTEGAPSESTTEQTKPQQGEDAGIKGSLLKEIDQGRKETTTEQKTQSSETQKQDDDDIPESDLQVLPHDKPKTAKRIQALLKRIEEASSTVGKTKKEIEERDRKLSELQEQLNKVKTVDPETQKRLDEEKQELAMLRRRYQLDKDPEVKTRFDSRIESSESSIEKTLTKHSGGDAFAKLLKDEGGWAKLSESGKVFTLPDGKRVTGAELVELVYADLPLVDKRAIDAALVDQLQAKRERERYFDEQTKTANDYFKRLEEESKKGEEEYKTKVETTKKELDEWQKGVIEGTDWLKPREIPANASAEEKKAIEEDNEYTKQLVGYLKSAFNPKGIKGVQEVVLDAVKYYQERRLSVRKDAQIAAQQAQIKELQEKIDKFKSAGRTVAKSGSIASGTQQQESVSRKEPSSLAEAIDMAARGDLGE